MITIPRRFKLLHYAQFGAFVRKAHSMKFLHQNNSTAGKSAYRKAPDTENGFPDTGESFSNMTELRVKQFEEESQKKVVNDRGFYEVRDRRKETEDADIAMKDVLEKDNEIYGGKKTKDKSK